MSGSDTLAFKVRQAVMSLPGKRGIDIPEHEYDAIFSTASGETLPLWGMHPTPWQMAELHKRVRGEDGTIDHEQIKKIIGDLPHPHAPEMTVSQYAVHRKALETFNGHSR